MDTRFDSYLYLFSFWGWLSWVRFLGCKVLVQSLIRLYAWGWKIQPQDDVAVCN